MEINAQARTTGKGRDYFQTPKECTRALINFMRWQFGNICNKEILDPCCGKMAIANELKKDLLNVYAYDIRNGIDFLKQNNQCYDIIIMNPPYCDKYKFIDHALRIAEDVFCLLPMQIVNYNLFHKKYLDNIKYIGRLLMTPKIILSENIEMKKGGASSYAWFWWSEIRCEYYSKEWYANLDEY